MVKFFSLLLKDEKGQSLVEYSLILLLAVIVVIFALTTLGQKNKNTFYKVSNCLVN